MVSALLSVSEVRSAFWKALSPTDVTLSSKTSVPLHPVLLVATPSTTSYVPPSQLKVVVAALAAGAKIILPNKPAMREKEIVAITAKLGFFFQVKSVEA